MKSGWTRAVEASRRAIPAMAALRVALLIGLVGLIVTGAAMAYRQRQIAMEVVREHPYFGVERIEIRGVGNLVSEDEVRLWLGVRRGDSLWDAAPKTLKARLESHPMVRAAAVRRVFPDTLEIRVRERQPSAITVVDQLYYVDRSGEKFGPLDTAHDRDYPVFTGLPDDADGQRRWALRRALHLLRRSETSELGLEISEIHLDPVDGLILYPTTPRVPLFLGWRGWERRLQRANRALQSWQGAAERIARVDLRFRDQVVIELREQRPIRAGGAAVAKVST